jgi:TonB-linked SusC/RagA family outer membrane protein
MKLTALLFFSFSVTVFAEGFSQSVSFSKINASLIDVFVAIKQQTGYVVFYDNDILKDASSVSLSVKDESLVSFLSLVFDNQRLSYSINKKTIVVKRLQGVITLNEKEAPLTKVFKEIKKQTGFRFFYLSQQMEEAKKVTIHVKDASLNEVLTLCFKDQPFGWEVKENVIIIKAKNKTVAEISRQPETGEPVTVNGKVTDAQGQPLVGANIKVKGSSVGTTTDNLGRFTLANLDENSILEISFVGHDAQSFHIKGKPFLTIALIQKQSLLDETIIIGYGTSSRRFTTGNIATIKAADIEKQPVLNPLLALQGRVTGVEITQQSGLPGGGVKVRIQGQNSIGNGNDPFIVVDGTPFPSQLTDMFVEGIVQGGSPLNYINPADIESIDILKDADATAIYGSRAANGAILITTKKGKAGRTKLGINLQQGWGKVTRKVEMMNTRQYLDMRYEAMRNSNSVLTDPTIVVNDLKVWDTTRYTDWQKTLIGGTAKYTNVNTSLSGGTTAVQYLVGAGFNRQTAVFPGNFDNKQGNLHFNINGASANQRLKLQLSGSYSYTQNHLPGTDLTRQAVLLEPDAPPLYNEDGTLNWAQNIAGTSTWTNPLAYTVSTDFNNTTKNLVSNVVVSYRILPGLELRTSAGYTNTSSEIFNPTRLELTRPESRVLATRTASFGNRNMSSWIVEPQLQYTRKWGKGRGDAFVGATISKNSSTALTLQGLGFPNDLLMKTLRAATSFNISASSSEVNRFNALFGRVNYIWDDKYLVNLTARRDGSNKFGDQNKFHNFGSAGLGWILSQEKWVQPIRWLLSFAKLRASYGTTGSDQIQNFAYLSIYYIQNPGILYQKGIGLYASNIPNPYLQWEETRKLQGGIDLGFLNDRILVGLTFGRNRSSNQLLGYVLPSLTGFTSINKNLPATVQNTSWEFTLNTVNIKTKHFSWNSSFNVTIPHNKLISFPGIESTGFVAGNNGVIIGQPLGVSKVYQYLGVNPANGAHMVLDKNENPTIGLFAAKRDKLISQLTKYYGGFVNNISYRGFQLDFLIQFVRKMGPRDLYWDNGSFSPGQFTSGASNQPVTVLNHWQKPGDVAPVPPFYTSQYSTSVKSSDAWYSFDASYLRLKNVSLSWQLPAGWLQRVHIADARLYFQGQNLATISNYTGLDPETMSVNALPPLQLWTIGMNLTL